MTDRPFPQFEDEIFTGTVREAAGKLVQAIVAWDAVAQAERPHVVLICDPEVKALRAVGPYENAYLANEAAVELDADLNDPANNDGAHIYVSVIPLEPS